MTKLVENTPVGHLYQRFCADRRCPYCVTQTVLVFEAHLSRLDPADITLWGPLGDYEHRSVKIWGCPACGWWHDEFAKIDPTYIGWERFRRVVRGLRKFTVESDDLPLRTLSSELLSHPNIIQQVHPRRLETFVGAVLADFFHAEVSVLGRSGDGGIDLVYVHSNTPFAVQVKRRSSSNAKEGVSLVREFLGACVLAGHRHPRIVTTAHGFTKGAAKAAQQAVERQLVDSFDLIDRDRFLALFRYSGLAYKYPWTPSAEEWFALWDGRDGATFRRRHVYLK